MKPSSVTPVTAALVAVLLGGAGICVGVRHAADRQRAAATDAAASGKNAGSTPPAVRTTKRERDAASSRAAGSRVSDRAAMHARLGRLWAAGSDLDRSRGLLEMIDRLNSADFPVFLEEARAFTGSNLRIRELIYSAWAERDPVAAMPFEIKEAGGVASTSTVLKVWAARNPIEALDWLTANGSADGSLEEVLRRLAANDPAAALAWAKDHDPPETGRGISHPRLEAALNGMIPSHLDDLIRSFSELPKEMRNGLLTSVGTQAGSLDAAGRKQWLESLREGDERNIAVVLMINGMHHMESVQERLQLLQEYPEVMIDPGVGSVFRRWAQEDAAAAVTAVGTLPEGRVRNDAANNAIEGLVELGDAKKSLELMNQYPEAVGEGTIQMWFGMAATNAHEWELAISQLPRVNSQAFREKAYREIMDSWLSTDRAAARAWLDSHDDVPETVREALELR